MLVGERLRQLREEKKLSQGDIEKRTGLLRCYLSRVENGHTTPAIETLEKIAVALEVPMWKMFGEEVQGRKDIVAITSLQEHKPEKHIRQLSVIMENMTPAMRSVVIDVARRLSKASKAA